LDLKKVLKCSERSRGVAINEAQQIEPSYVPSPGEQTLVFESRFESGNLSMAIKVSDHEYNLVLQNDVNSMGHTQWFYFKVGNTTKDLNVKFNMINLGKPDSLFNHGMKVLVYSETENKLNSAGWFRGGEDISYFANGIRKPNSNKTYYTLSFKYVFAHSGDSVFFAYSFPYTYSDLMTDLSSLEKDPVKSQIFNRRLLCYSLGGNRCDYLTVTSSASPDVMKKRKGVVISARAHPGESVGSWMMKGVIDFLTSNSREACLLRENFIFKIIPMINPDGVINGNYRCSLAGCDLNRRWKNPSKTLHPIIHSAKRMIKSFCKEREVELICDLHGHSRRKNVFMYGCNIPDKPELTRTFPYILSKVSPFFAYNYCAFRMQKSKESTLRISLFKDTKIPFVYTLEASFCGPNFGAYEGLHHTTQDLQSIGKHICLSLLVNAEIEVPQSPEPQPNPEGHVPILTNIKKNEIVNELLNNKELLEDNGEDSSGSDSDPSEDNLEPEVFSEILPISPKKKSPEKKKRPITTKKRNKSIRSINIPVKKREELPPPKCTNCNEVLTPNHVCPKPKPRTRPTMRRNLYSTSQAYYNAAGKKVRDQATQTPNSTQMRTASPDSKTRSVSQRTTPKDPRRPERSFQSNYSRNLGNSGEASTAFPNIAKKYHHPLPSWKLPDFKKC